MVHVDTVAVVGGGVIGAAVAYALAREGRGVVLLDRAEPGMTGASFGNAGHIAAELVEPLPSWDLLFGFWRELFALGGVLDIPLRRVPHFLPWALRFASAARHRAENTRHLAPLVKPAAGDMARWLAEIGRPELLRTNGHYQVWFGPRSDKEAADQALLMERLGIPTQAAPDDILQAIAQQSAESLEPKTNLRDRICAHRGPVFSQHRACARSYQVVQSFVGAALQRGASFKRTEVRAIEPLEERIALQTTYETLSVDALVVCTGAWAATLLEPLGLRVPMESARGYHVELVGHLRSPTRQSFMPTRAFCSLPWKDDYAPPALWSLPEATLRPTRENWHVCVHALGSWATIVLPMARAGLDHDRCFPTIFRASVDSNTPLSSMR